MGEAGGAKKFVVQIPSAAEVEQASVARPQPLNFFRPSSSVNSNSTAGGSAPSAPAEQPTNSQTGQAQASTFTEAFSFLRNTEFYSPPPAVPLPRASSSVQGTAPPSGTGNFKKEEAYVPPPYAAPGRNVILVSNRQKGNSVLKHIRNARWTFADIVPDYILGQNSCALYLSLRYHLLHPDYIYFRIRELQKSFRLRVVLCHVDVDDVIKPLHEVTKTCLLHDCSLLCAWSQEECARYLETIKIYENKPADYIQERTDSDYLSRLTSSLTTVRHVNKTDVLTLGSSFGTLSAIFNAAMEDLARCPGIGERKVKRLYDAFNEPFRRVPTAKLPRQSTGDKSEADASKLQTPEQDGVSAGKPMEEGREAIPASKLINREGEVSIREALTAVREKLIFRTSQSDVNIDESIEGQKNPKPQPTQTPQIEKVVQPQQKSIPEENVISLSD